jgi:hypothetical protein
MPVASSKPKARFVACIAANLLDTHTFSGKPTTLDQWYEVTKDEARVMTGQMISNKTPVKVQHLQHTIAGNVINAYFDKKGRWMAEFEIPLEGFTHSMANLVNRKEMVGVSLRHNRVTLEPAELTICTEGAREGSAVEYRLPPLGYEAKYDPKTGYAVPPPVPSSSSSSSCSSEITNPTYYTQDGQDVWVSATRPSKLKMHSSMAQQVPPQQIPAVMHNMPSYMSTPQQQQYNVHQPPQQQPARDAQGRFLPTKSEQDHQATMMTDVAPPSQQGQGYIPSQTSPQAAVVASQQQAPAVSSPQVPAAINDPNSWLLKASAKGGAHFTEEDLANMRNVLSTLNATNQQLTSKAKEFESAQQQLDKQNKAAKEAVVASLEQLISTHEGKPIPKERIESWKAAITDNNMDEFVRNISNELGDVVSASKAMRQERDQYLKMIESSRSMPPPAPRQPSYQQPQQQQGYDESFLRSMSNVFAHQSPDQSDNQWVNASAGNHGQKRQHSEMSSSSSSRNNAWDITNTQNLNCTAQDAAEFTRLMKQAQGMDLKQLYTPKYYSGESLDYFQRQQQAASSGVDM